MKKGRHNNAPRPGELNSNAKLKTENIIHIRALSSDGHTHCSIAKLFGVSDALISKIVNRILWSHVP